MRVAVVTTSWPADATDPAGHFVRSEARALEESGHEVVVVAPAVGGAFGWPGVAARVRERPSRALGAMRWVLRARGQLEASRVNRVVAHWAVPCAWPIAFAARDAALEAVSHGGDVRLLIAIPAPARRLAVGAIASRAERWRFASETLLSTLLEALDREMGALVSRVACIQPAAIDLLDVRQAVAQRRLALGETRVAVTVGRLVATKRVDRVIQHVAMARDVDALVVVGDGPERECLERMAHTYGVRAHFVGKVSREEALAWIGAADALVHASEAEGLSTVVREAEALGTRVVKIGPVPG